MKLEELLAKWNELISRLEPGQRGTYEPYPDYRVRLNKAEAENPALTPYETKGRAKFLSKYPQMKSNYAGAQEKAKEEYDKLPFGPQTKEAFRLSMNAGAARQFDEKTVVSHEKKWAYRWMRSIRR